MSKYVANEFVEEYHGKMCMHSTVSFAKRGKTKYTMKRCNERNMEKNPFTGKELKNQAIFRATREAISALTPAEKLVYQEAWRAYKGDKYYNLNGFIFGQEYAKAKAAYEAENLEE